MAKNDPQHEQKLKALTALRAWLQAHGGLKWNSTENTAVQRVVSAVDVLQSELSKEQ